MTESGLKKKLGVLLFDSASKQPSLSYLCVSTPLIEADWRPNALSMLRRFLIRIEEWIASFHTLFVFTPAIPSSWTPKGPSLGV